MQQLQADIMLLACWHLCTVMGSLNLYCVVEVLKMGYINKLEMTCQSVCAW